MIKKTTVNSDIFGNLLSSEGLFENREAMRPSYIPDLLPHRDKEINHLASILVPALRGETPSNVFIYGKTGTGKTGAFAIPILGKLENNKKIQCLVLTPTRELANQVAEDFASLSKYMQVRNVAIFGGQSIKFGLLFLGVEAKLFDSSGD